MKRTIFSAYKSTSTDSFISMEQAKPLLKKLLCTAEVTGTVNFSIQISATCIDVPQTTSGNFEIFTTQEQCELIDFLNKNSIKCLLLRIKGTKVIYNIPQATSYTRIFEAGCITFFNVANKDELIEKLDKIYEDQAVSEQQVSRQNPLKTP